MYDSGSHVSILARKVAAELNAPLYNTGTSICGVGGQSSGQSLGCKVVLQNIEGAFHQTIYPFVMNQPMIPEPPTQIDLVDFLGDALDGRALADSLSPVCERPVDLILGQDAIHQSLHGSIERPFGNGGLVLIESEFGVTVQGELPYMVAYQHVSGLPATADRQQLVSTAAAAATSAASVEQKERLQKLTCLLESFWDLEHAGITKVELSSKEKAEDKAARELFSSTVKFLDDEKRFQVALLFREDSPPLGNNFKTALKLLEKTEAKFAVDPAFEKQYRDYIDDYKRRGDIEVVPEEKAPPKGAYYMPHHGVSTPKFRVVFNASSPSQTGASLNDCLYTGPVEKTDLLRILVRSRFHQFIFCADIAKMYTQILIRPEDRDFLRFLWRENPSLPPQIMRLLKVTFGVRDSAFLATECAKLQALKFVDVYPDAALALIRDRWCDDFHSGANTLEAARDIVTHSDEIMDKGSLPLAKWSSNDPRVLEGIIPLDRQNHSARTFTGQSEDDNMKVQNALGVKWHPIGDTYSYDVSKALGLIKDRPTRALVASIQALIYDPLGILAPFLVVAKQILQDLWAREPKAGWYEPVKDDDVIRRWQKWVEQIKFLSEITFPRKIMSFNNPRQIDLHIFGDASITSIGIAAYAVVEYPGGVKSSRLICGRARNVKKNSTTIPRSELLAAQFASELASNIVDYLACKDIQVHLWTDSEITLWWIWTENPSSLSQFVCNRVKIVRENFSDTSRWRHCPGSQNPADLASRGMKAEQLRDSTLWWQGAPFLILPEDQWPPRLSKDSIVDAATEEDRLTFLKETSKTKKVTAAPVSFNNNRRGHDSELTPIDKLIAKEASLRKITRILSVVCAFPYCGTRSPQTQEIRNLDPYAQAELFLIRNCQQRYFSEEIAAVAEGSTVHKKSSIAKFSPFLDGFGILRSAGRLEHAIGLSEDEIHPIILHKGPFLTRLILQTHEDLMHSGPERTRYEIRKRFIANGLTRAIRELKRKCFICQRFSVRPAEQKMAALPENRVAISVPFSHIGIDYFGPVYLQDSPDQDTYKSWVLLFTCMTTRALHLELCRGMSTEDVLFAFRKFVARRGAPTLIVSDNFKSFIAAAADFDSLESEMDEATIRERIIKDYRIKWEFIPERAPHWGGFYESLVKSVKSPLRRSLHNLILNFENMACVLLEVEQIVNNRPLTNMSDDSGDLLPISPNKLIFGHDLTSFPQLPTGRTKASANAPADRKAIRESWKLRQAIQGRFWDRWTKEYLQTLHARAKWHKEKEPIKVGQVVLIKDDQKKRPLWPLAVVTEVFEGRGDSLVRAAMVKTAKGIMRRPIVNLCPLETDIFLVSEASGSAPADTANQASAQSARSVLPTWDPKSAPFAAQL